MRHGCQSGAECEIADLQSAYHGVPIVALPFFADQPDNAGKVVAKVSGKAYEWALTMSMSMTCMIASLLRTFLACATCLVLLKAAL